MSLLKIPLDFLSSQPQTLFEIKIVTGRHSSGVTTTGAKLACHLKQAGRNVFLISNDLLHSTKMVYLRKQITQRNIDVQKSVQAADSVATIHNLLQSTRFLEPLSVIIDVSTHFTAGDTEAHELYKLHDMMSKEFPDASIENIGVFDAKNGQQFLPQFRDMFSFAGLKSVILTKVDISNKIGCAFAVVDDIGAPIAFLGIGEDTQHLVTLNPENFVDALFSLK